MSKLDKASLTGERPTNEDQEVFIDNLDGKDKSINNITFFGIFDGHAGPKVSEYLAQNLPQYFFSKDVQYPIKKNRVMEIYDLIQKKLANRYGDYAKEQGSTALVGIIFKNKGADYIQVFNLGDCRLAICRNDIGVPLTNDHKPNKPHERKRIKKIGGEIYFDGHDYRTKSLSVSRAFGDLDAKPEVSHLPEVFRYRLELTGKGKDKFLVFACDGLWDVMTEQEVVDFILDEGYDIETGKRINKQTNIAHKLATHAIKVKRSTDNVSVMIYHFSD